MFTVQSSDFADHRDDAQDDARQAVLPGWLDILGHNIFVLPRSRGLVVGVKIFRLPHFYWRPPEKALTLKSCSLGRSGNHPESH